MSNLLFDFTVDKAAKTVFVTREFAADLDLVWDAFTKAEILDQWTAPKPFVAKTKFMDFKVGGRRFYAMVSPEGQEKWSIQQYTSISPKTNFKMFNAFADEDENPQLPGSDWDYTFSEQNEITQVSISIYNESLERLEKMIEMGFTEGFKMSLENLDQYISAQFLLRKQNKINNMARVSTYLNFPGNTEEAFKFYKSVFKTEFINGIQRFGDIPSDPNQPPISENVKKMVLHIELPTLGGHILMGTDAPKEMGMSVAQGNNMYIQIEPDTRENADYLFRKLSEGGKIEMPIQEMPWGSYFGSFTDKYGINWMINFLLK
ncbi:MAG: SRPBCC domain-containing protein [Bacteroidetes bacterium]|nr:SRPBCC domain-containing protein [Bacteroidota bacterium]